MALSTDTRSVEMLPFKTLVFCTVIPMIRDVDVAAMKSATDSDTQTAAQKLPGHRNISTTTIYRRDRKEVIDPLILKSLFGMEHKQKTVNEDKN